MECFDLGTGVAITVDIDWAPDPLIRDTMSILDEHGVPATVFSTHDDDVKIGEAHERALHPNYFREDDDTTILSEMMDLFPDASGIRSHGLYTYTNLRSEYADFGLSYESNYLLFGQEDIAPFRMYENIIQFPIYFMDDMWLRREKPAMKQWSDLNGINVFAFHPIHIYLNTTDIEYYEQHKHHYDQPDELRRLRQSSHGVRDAFQELATTIDDNDLRAETLGTFESEIRNQL